jgi:F-type H+-transporting ATPase subunit gamma
MMTSQFLIPTQQRNFGANEKALKIRMKSVNSIKKITKAMKMVAASKMAGDLRRLSQGKNYGTNSVDMIFKSDTYMQRRTGAEEKSDPKYLLCPITSDKGMCGGVNSGIFKNVREFVSDKKRENVQIFSIGSKGASAMRRPMPDMLKTNVCEISTPYNYPTIMALAEHIIQAAEGSDKIVVFYN